MEVYERIRRCRLFEKIEKQKSFAEQLGIEYKLEVIKDPHPQEPQKECSHEEKG